MCKTIGIAGLGLMGGSFAKAIRERAVRRSEDVQILALDNDDGVLRRAKTARVIDEGFSPAETPAMLERCDLTIICLYPRSSINFLREYRLCFKKNAIVTDISGVKQELFGVLPEILHENFDFICGHPMAGSEKEGFEYAQASIFRGRTYILMPMPSNRPENFAFFREFVLELGFAAITETAPALHDHKIGFTSQLCHVIASALVDSAEDTGITAFGGGSYEELTRIAMINAPLWTELFLANRGELLAHIGAFEASLNKLKLLIEKSDAKNLEAALRVVREKRAMMSS